MCHWKLEYIRLRIKVHKLIIVNVLLRIHAFPGKRWNLISYCFLGKRGLLPCIVMFTRIFTIRRATVRSWYAEEVGPVGHACAFAYVRSYYSPLFLEATQVVSHNARLVICEDRAGAVTLCVRVPHVRTMSTRTTMTTRTTTMFERKSDSMLLTNGSGNLVGDIRKEEPARFWTKIRLNEWTFSLSLLGLSLSIVIGKLYANYGE